MTSIHRRSEVLTSTNALCRTLALLASTLFVGLAIAPSSHADASFRVISRDPYTNADAYHETEVGPVMAVNGSMIVSAFQMGRFPGSGATNIGFSTSMDSGQTWTSGALPGTTAYSDPPGPYLWVSQPSIAYSANQGVWLMAGVGYSANWNVFLSRSLDGTTWDPPVLVAESNFFVEQSPNLACDNWASSPYYGSCYLKWDEQYELLASFSRDDGLTWTSSSLPLYPESAGGSIVVKPSGRVVMAVGDEYTDLCCTYVSLDGGASYRWYGLHFGNTQAPVEGNLRAFNFGSLAVDDTGHLFLVLSGCKFRAQCSSNDILLARGKSGWRWGPYRRVPIDPVTSGADHFMPGIAVEPGTSGDSAHLAIRYWSYPDAECSEATCQLSVGLIESHDGGLTWDDPVGLGGPFHNTWYPLQNAGYMVGDYSPVVFVPGGLVTVFANAQPSPCQLGSNDCRVAMAAVRVLS